jgi:hypothetical protein
MYLRLDRAHRAVSVVLGVITLVVVAAVLFSDAFPQVLPGRGHDRLAAASLAMIAFSYLVYQAAHRPGWKEWVKAILLAAAFVFWAANQAWPDTRQAILLNDMAIALFVLDVFLVMVGWPSGSPDESFGETFGASEGSAPEGEVREL